MWKLFLILNLGELVSMWFNKIAYLCFVNMKKINDFPFVFNEVWYNWYVTIVSDH
jgi:hypothetical protein